MRQKIIKLLDRFLRYLNRDSFLFSRHRSGRRSIWQRLARITEKIGLVKNFSTHIINNEKSICFKTISRR